MRQEQLQQQEQPQQLVLQQQEQLQQLVLQQQELLQQLVQLQQELQQVFRHKQLMQVLIMQLIEQNVSFFVSLTI